MSYHLVLSVPARRYAGAERERRDVVLTKYRYINVLHCYAIENVSKKFFIYHKTCGVHLLRAAPEIIPICLYDKSINISVLCYVTPCFIKYGHFSFLLSYHSLLLYSTKINANETATNFNM